MGVGWGDFPVGLLVRWGPAPDAACLAKRGGGGGAGPKP